MEGLGGLGPHGEGEKGHNSLGGGGGTWRGGSTCMVSLEGMVFTMIVQGGGG